MDRHWLSVYGDAGQYRSQLQEVMAQRLRRNQALLLIALDEHFPTIQQLLLHDPAQGAGIKVRSAQKMAARWFSGGHLRPERLGQDADAYLAELAPSTGDGMWLLDEVADGLWRRGKHEQTLEFEEALDAWLQDNGVGVACPYHAPELHRVVQGHAIARIHGTPPWAI